MYAQTAMKVVDRAAYPIPAMCKGMEREAASRIAAISSVQSVEAGKALFAEGDDADNVYEVVGGMLKLYKLLPDGRRQIMGFVTTGDLLGLSFGGAYLYTAEAVTDVTLCRYTRARFDRLVDEVPGFARRLLAVRSDELRTAQDQMLLLGRKTAVEKIASFLLTLADRQADSKDPNVVNVPMGRCDIADYLGLTTETVCRTLTKLKSTGVIKSISVTNIKLLDRDKLEDSAAGEFQDEL
jgi:CRP/FNR family transcriptional regulator